MSLFSLIKSKLSPLNIPVFRLTANTNSNQYITVTEYNNSGSLYADDDEISTRISVQVDLYSKGNYDEVTKRIKDLLKPAGFRKSGEHELYEYDTEYYHKVLRFYYEQENGGVN